MKTYPGWPFAGEESVKTPGGDASGWIQSRRDRPRSVFQSEDSRRGVPGCGGSSAKLGETLRDDMSVRETRLRALVHEPDNGGGESCPEYPRFDRSDVSILESSKELR